MLATDAPTSLPSVTSSVSVSPTNENLPTANVSPMNAKAGHWFRSPTNMNVVHSS